VSDDRLIDALWGDDQPANPANSLQAQVSQLRRVLGREVVTRHGSGYALAVEPDDVDALLLERFVALARQASDAGDHRGAAQHYRSALELVRGPALGDLLDFAFARDAAGRLEELLLVVHEGLAEAELASGRHAEIVGTLSELARAHPLRERFAALLITALYRCGRQVDALRAYAELRDALVDEFGVDPSPELQALERAVLAQDAALAAPTPAPASAPVARSSSDDAPAPESAVARGAAFRHTPGRLPLVGREAEVAALLTDLEDALVGRGRIAILVGEPGIGKTRLAEHVAELAEDRGAAVGWGRGHDGAGASAFWSWRQVIRTLFERVPAELVVPALGRGAVDIAHILPEVHDLVPGLEPPPVVDPESTKFRVVESCTAFLRALARERPLVVTLDDVQWADPASLHLLAFLAREVTDASLLVLVTYRSVGAPAGSHLAETLALVMRQPIVRRIDLPGLDRDALASLVEAAGGRPDDAFVSTVHRRTQGNPFFAVEVLRLLPAAGSNGGSAGGGTLAVPGGVRDAIRQRLRLLPAETVSVLGSASVLGQDFDLAILTDVVGAEAVDVLERLEPASDAGIVSADGAVGRYRFSHGLVNETLYDDLGAAAKARAHQRVAGALEAWHGDTDGAHVLDVAAHWARAVPAAPAERAARSAIRAAAWAADHLAHDQAEAQLRSALTLIASLPAGRARDVLELEAQDRLSVLQIVTIGYASPEVVRACDRMRELCGAVDDPRLLVPALWRLAIYYCIGMQLDTALSLGEQLLALAGADERITTPALAGHLALGTILTHRGDIAPARRHLDLAGALLDAGHGEPLAGVIAETPQVWAKVFSAWNWWLHGDSAAAERLVASAVVGAEAAGEAYGTTFARWFSVLVATLRRDPAAVMERCERGVGPAQEQGFAMFVPYMLVSRGWALAVTGEHEIGCDELAGAASMIKASGARMMAHVFPAFHADACLAAGRLAAALDAADDGLRAVEETGERWFEAELHRLRGVALAGLDASDPAAVTALRRAVDVATAQGAGALRARASASLAELEESPLP
jgi:DNA-binding SARP family transcriptional activator